MINVVCRMNPNNNRPQLLVFAFLAAALATVLHADSHSYSVTDIGTLGGTYSAPVAINDDGDVVGGSQLAGDVGNDVHAFRYHDGVLEDIGATLGLRNVATGINNRGEIVGWTGEPFQRHPFLYRDGMLNVLDVPNDASTRGINARGDFPINLLVPHAQDGFQVLLYSQGQVAPLVNINNSSAQAAGINARGEVLGTAAGHMFIAWRGGITYLQLPQTITPDFAVAINARGDALFVGSILSDNQPHSFLYSHDSVSDLGSFFGSALNDRGDVVGNAISGPVLYRNGELMVLRSLPGLANMETADAINGVDQIAGVCDLPSGERHACLLTPQ
jgi:probable HAF family extracellular repeat protein